MDVFSAALEARGFLCNAALAAGHELGVFGALARGGPASLEELAARIGVVAGHHRLRALLEVLAALGAIRCDRSVAQGIAGAAPGSVVLVFAAAAAVPPCPVVARAGWGLLADVIRNDHPLPAETDDAESVRRLHHHLASAGAAAAKELARSFGATSLLDLGSGAGAYSKAFLEANPAGRATLVDIREVLALAAEHLGPLAGRARLVEGDGSMVATGDGHGAVLLANLLHLHSPAMCARLCAAAARAISPGGVVVIKDLRVDDDRAGPIEGLLFALNMAIYTEAGDVYPTSQLRAWLAEAGLIDIVERRLAAAPDAIVVTGRRPNDPAAAGAGPATRERTESNAAGANREAASDSAESCASRTASECAAAALDPRAGGVEHDAASDSAGACASDAAGECVGATAEPDRGGIEREAASDSAESCASRTAGERARAAAESGVGGVEREAASDSAESCPSQAMGERADAAVKSGEGEREAASDSAESGSSRAAGECAGAGAESRAGKGGRDADSDSAESCAESVRELGDGSAQLPGDARIATIAAELDTALAETADQAWRELVVRGAIRDDVAAGPPALAMPQALRGFLAAAVALERSEAGADSAERASQLIRHYTDAMPRMRVAQPAGTDEPGATLFHTPLDWDRLPRLGAAIDRLYAVLADAGVSGADALGAASADAFRARSPTLAALYRRTHYGGFMPLLYGFPADLAYAQARGAADGFDVIATIDRYLTAPIVHELCHFGPGRAAIAPPHLDECIAGWLGVHVHPELAYPAAECDDALYAAPWLAQVGQAIARAFGIAQLVRAHAGGDPAALPAPFVAAAARLGWGDWCARRTLHFLSDTFDPAPWVALALMTAAGRSPAGESLASLAAIPLASLELSEDPRFDRAIVEDALRAMCLASTQVAGSFRTRSQLVDGAIMIDAAACAVVAPGRGALDPVVPRYWLPPTVAARIVAQGSGGYTLRLGALTAIPEAASAICDASSEVEREGFALLPGRREPAVG